MLGVLPLSQQIRRVYAQKGIFGLLRAALPYIRRKLLQPISWTMTWFILRLLLSDIIDRKELKSITSDNGRYWEYGQREEFEITYEKSQSDLPQEFEKMTGGHETDQPFVCEITCARLVGKSAIGLTEDDRLILETAEANQNILWDRIEDMFLTEGIIQTIMNLYNLNDSQDATFNRVFPLIKHPSTNYYHWMLGYLGKIRALESYREETNNDPTILIAENSPSWVLESLKLAGYDAEVLEKWKNGQVHTHNLIIPFHRLRYGKDFNPSPDECRYLRELILSNLDDISENNYSDRIYISREDADSRRIRNEEEILETLYEIGFEKYVLTEMSVGQQARLFAGASIIVAPHGAGLTNLIFSEDITVVEIFPENNIQKMYFCLARQLGFDYEFLLADQIGVDIHVDKDQLKDQLKKVIKSD